MDDRTKGIFAIKYIFKMGLVAIVKYFVWYAILVGAFGLTIQSWPILILGLIILGVMNGIASTLSKSYQEFFKKN